MPYPKIMHCVWKNKEEWEAVYNGLFSGNVCNMRWAVDRITVWKCRSFKGLDIGIDVTAQIVHAFIQDTLFESKAMPCQLENVCTSYEMAIIRFVNLVTERRSRVRSNLLRLKAAWRMGIPGWIISIRNSASHGQIPDNIEELRHAAQHALDWLKREYWAKEKQRFVDYTPLKNNKLDDEIRDRIWLYQRYRFKFLFGDLPANNGKSKKFQVKVLKKYFPKQTSLFFEIFLQPGFFFPSRKDLMRMLKHRDGEMEFATSGKTSNIDLPTCLQDFWMPFITLLSMKNCVQQFVESLFLHLNATDALQQKIAACWISKLLDQNDKDPRYIFKAIPEDDRVSYKWIRLLGPCVQNCCPYTPALLPVIVDNIYPPLCPEKKHEMMALVAVYLGATSSPDSSNTKHVFNKELFTLHNLKEDLKLRQEHKDPENIWHQCPDDMDWSSVPFGVFGDEKLFTTNISPLLETTEANIANQEDKTAAAVVEKDPTVNEEAPTEEIEFKNPGINLSRIKLYPSMIKRS